MTKIEKWESLLQNVLSDPAHCAYQWLINSEPEHLTTYSSLVNLTDELKELIDKKTSSIDGISSEDKELIEALRYIWDTRRRYFFKTNFVSEILNSKNHPLHAYFTELIQGIHSYTHYLSLEAEWKKQVISFYSNLRTEFSNLAKLALLKVYTAQKNHYYEEILPVEIQTEKENPFYIFTTLCKKESGFTESEILAYDRQLKEVEQIILAQNEQFQKKLINILKPYANKGKELCHQKDKKRPSRWEILVLEVQRHPEWVKTNKLLTQILELESPEEKMVEALERTFQDTKKSRMREMGVFDFNWTQLEIEKRLRVLKKQSELNQKNQFGDWIREMRDKHNISLRRLGRLSGVSTSYIHRLELGERKSPSIPVAEKIAKAFGASINDVVGFLDTGDLETQPHLLENHAVGELDLLKQLQLNDVTIGEVKLSKRKQDCLVQLLELVVDKSWDPENISDNIEMINLIKKIRKNIA